MSEDDLLKNILSGTYYGFACVDISSPPEFIEKYGHLNFPPLIRKSKIEPEWVSPHMKEQMAKNNVQISSEETVIQTYHAKNIFLSTRMIQFYAELGLRIDNIASFVQYKPARPLRPFVEKVTEGRQRATRENNESLGLAYKLEFNKCKNCLAILY